MKFKLVADPYGVHLRGLDYLWGAIPVGIRQSNIFFSGRYSRNRCIRRPEDGCRDRARLLGQRGGGTGGD